jgi:hypothetical protein
MSAAVAPHLDSHQTAPSDEVSTSNRPVTRIAPEETTAMLHFSCDYCGKDLIPGVSSRYVVRMESYAASDPSELTEEDIDTDQVEEMARLLDEQVESEAEEESFLSPGSKKMRFDLCQSCHRKFLADPLGRDNVGKLHFSEN